MVRLELMHYHNPYPSKTYPQPAELQLGSEDDSFVVLLVGTLCPFLCYGHTLL